MEKKGEREWERDGKERGRERERKGEREWERDGEERGEGGRGRGRGGEERGEGVLKEQEKVEGRENVRGKERE